MIFKTVWARKARPHHLKRFWLKSQKAKDIENDSDWSWPPFPIPSPHPPSSPVIWHSPEPSAVPELPFEIWSLICAYLPQRTLWSLRTLNSTFLALAMDAKYESVLFEPWLDPNATMDRLVDPWVASRVRTAVMPLSTSFDDQISRALKGFLRLRSLKICNLSTTCFHANIPPCMGNSLTTLDLNIDPEISTDGSPDTHLYFPNLTSLSLNYSWSFAPDDVGWPISQGNAVQSDAFATATRVIMSMIPQRLQELRLLSGCTNQCLSAILDHLLQFHVLQLGPSWCFETEGVISSHEVLKRLGARRSSIRKLVVGLYASNSSRTSLMEQLLCFPNLQDLCLLRGHYNSDPLFPHAATELLTTLTSSSELRSLAFPLCIITPEILEVVSTLFPALDSLTLSDINIPFHQSSFPWVKLLPWIIAHTDTVPFDIRFLNLAQKQVICNFFDDDGYEMLEDERDPRFAKWRRKAICEAFARCVDLEHFERSNCGGADEFRLTCVVRA